ncbi:MFS transporter [Blastococcus sp. Marseille-P5729]|uniref:MFS transporter n=1 Tax=Blastococcus sp. Marseille-P5729 TaxID=2086582 RepID=UPI0018FF09B0|nr:MFS transporter [Blastococcus sp. Marseille-P5729]
MTNPPPRRPGFGDDRGALTSPSVVWYHRLVTADADGESAVGGAEQVARNGLRQIAANALQSAGDQVVNAKTVLPWILGGLGAPAAFVALLVPIRESGSMLPQAAVMPWVVSQPRRSRVWIIGALVQAVSVLAIAATAALLEQIAAGVAIIVALGVFALGRALCSMASKDVLGRTLPKGQRGQISGLSTVVSGVAAVAIGLALRAYGDDLSPEILAIFLVGASLTWILGAAVYRTIQEPPPTSDSSGGAGWWREMIQLLSHDAPFRRFVTVRALLLVSALAPPFFVTLAADYGSTTISGLGGFVIASALGSIAGGWISGRLADRSSRRLMMVGAAAASLLVIAVVVVVLLTGDPRSSRSAAGPTGEPRIGWVFTLAFFLVSLVHVAVRVARKTYVVDMAEGDQRTRYVAVANTAMGIILLVTGGISAVLAGFGEIPALVFLAALGLLGAMLAARMPDVSKR